MANSISRFYGWVALVSGSVVLAALTGCVGDMPHGGAWSAPSETRAVSTATASWDEYSYYPAYGIYYNTTRHQYVRLESDGWSTRSEPTGVSTERLLASPAVPMNFHDSPAQHHDSVVRQYPKNWPSSGIALMTGSRL